MADIPPGIFDEHGNLISGKGKKLKLPEKNEFIRNLSSPEEIGKNIQFNEELRKRGLCLAVTRTWGNRTLSSSSTEWKKLRMSKLIEVDFTCRFCGISSEKWMVCDHIDGNASNNSPENLGINCPICDLLRHSGRAGTFGQLLVGVSGMAQIDIVKKTQGYWKKHGTIPKPNVIDPEVVIKGNSAVFANELLKRNYSELTEEELSYRGFYRDDAKTAFNKVIPTI